MSKDSLAVAAKGSVKCADINDFEASSKLPNLYLQVIPSDAIVHLGLLAKRRTLAHTARMPLLDGIDGGSFEGGCAVTARGAGSAASLSAACSELEYEQLLLAEAEVRVSVSVRVRVRAQARKR